MTTSMRCRQTSESRVAIFPFFAKKTCPIGFNEGPILLMDRRPEKVSAQMKEQQQRLDICHISFTAIDPRARP